MSKFHGYLFLAALFMLVGCSTTGGTLGNLYPTSKSLKGKINNNIYTAQDRSFSVKIPHKEGSYEFTYMQVKEQYVENGIYVSFGPFAFDQSIYRINIDRPPAQASPRTTFGDLAPKFVDIFKTQLQEGYGTDPEETETRQETINGKRAYYYKLIQTLTGEKSGKFVIKEGQMVPEEVSVTHDVYVIDFGEKGAALIGVQSSEIEGHTPGLEPRAFAESATMH